MRKEVIGGATLYLGNCMDILPELPEAGLCVADPPYSSGGLMRSDRLANPLKKYVSGVIRLFPETTATALYEGSLMG